MIKSKIIIASYNYLICENNEENLIFMLIAHRTFKILLKGIVFYTYVDKIINFRSLNSSILLSLSHSLAHGNLSVSF